MAKKVTLRDIAQMVGLSPSAVSLVARGDPGVADETRRRVLDVMRQVGYTPRGNGAGQTTKGVLALVVEKLPLPVLSDIAYAEVVGGMQAEARARGYFLTLHEITSDAELQSVVEDAANRHFAGLLVLGGGDLTDQHVLQLTAANRPTVLVDNFVYGQQLDCVLPDHVTAGFLATDHLIRLGHRRIAFLAGAQKYKPLTHRLEGYLGAMFSAGLEVDPVLIPAPVSGTPRKGYLQMKQLLALPSPPTAVVAVSDKSAFGALEAIREANLRVPDDVALVGIDDVLESAHTDPPLTTVAWPKRELGMLAVRQLLHRMRHPESPPLKTLVYSRLVVRNSCGSVGITPNLQNPVVDVAGE